MELPLDQKNISCSASLLGSGPTSDLRMESPPPSCSGTMSLVLLQYTVGSVLIFIIFLSISGNILVCIAIYTDRRLRKLGNLFLVSLALADLFLATLVMTFAVANDMMGYWMFGSSFCEIWIAFDVMCCTASILNLAAISLDRFLHIKDPLSYERWMTKRVILTSVTGIWLLSFLVSFLPISLGWHRPTAPTDDLPVSNANQLSLASPVQRPQCALDLTPVYAVVSSSISFYIPCIIMIGLYTRLYLYAKKHVRNIRSVTKSLQLDQEKHLNSSDGSSLHSKHQQVSEHKAAITLGVIMGTFIFCWVPFFIANIIDAFCKTCIPVPLFKILTWLGYFNSAMNPVIYSIFNTEFRDAFRRILISYAHNECCDRRRESRGTMDLLVAGKRCGPRYSTSEAAAPHSSPRVANLPSTYSLSPHARDAGTSEESGGQYQSMTGNHRQSNKREKTIEVMQDKSIELSFFPAGSSMDEKQKISAI